MKLGNKVKLTGITRHGKNRVREQGALWRVVGESLKVHFKSSAPGPFLLLESEENEGPHGFHARWVSLQRDPDFMIEVIGE
tara:strand:+ start:471 stop:713 length:243 start_codon:yes stop_codon:yes gene_type:complete